MSFLRFIGRYGRRLFPGPGGVGTSPGQLVVGGIPCAFLKITGGGLLKGRIA